MQVHSERFENRFAKLFDQEGLMNVKFFVMKKNSVSLPDFLEEAAGIQDTIAAGDVTVIESIDGSTMRKQFDAAF